MPETTTVKVSTKDYNNKVKPTWCPGCGDFGILSALKKSLSDMNIAPHQVMIVGGIGCGSKLPDYIQANGYMTIHGRPLPIATGIKLANPELHVIVTDGDGDGYGIGGNHFLHTCRRNPDITHIVENNQIYALTKGQYSPTSDPGFVTTTSPEGSIERAINPIALALSAGATFIARSYAGDPKHMAAIISEAIFHPGYALVDILQPCVTFNKVNTYDWYAERSYKVEDEDSNYDPTDKDAAWKKALQWGERIPLGIIYRNTTIPTYGSQVPGLKNGPVATLPVAKLPANVFDKIKQTYV